MKDPVKELQALIDKAEKAEERKQAAEREAANIELRNKLKQEAYDKDFKLKTEASQKHLDELFAEEIEAIKQSKSQIKALKAKEATLQRKSDTLLEETQRLAIAVNDLLAQKNSLERDIIADQKNHEDKIGELELVIRTHNEAIDSLRDEILNLNTARHQITEDVQQLRNTQDVTEDQIMELDASYKSQKEQVANELREGKAKLATTLNTLEAAQAKDKEIRQAWSEGHKRLELREAAVNKMELKVNGLQSRANELSNYLSL